MLEAIVASIGYAGGIITEKFVLSKYRVPVARYLPLLFIWLCIITAVLMPKWGGLNYNIEFCTRFAFLFVSMIVVAVTWNIFKAQGIQKEDLFEFELIMLMSPLATIIFAAIFLPTERQWGIFVPAIIASVALLATRFRKHHVKISKVAWKTILAMLLISIESILIKELLGYFSPVTLYFIRTLFVAASFIALYKPKLFTMPTSAFALTIVSAVFGVVQMVLKFYGFQSLGVIETTMILVLGPFLVYLASAKIFREKIHFRDLAAALVVVVCILYVEFFN